ncbi:hypothetical protein JCM8097_003711 [Rhodosporidiobolus ruineniae]
MDALDGNLHAALLAALAANLASSSAPDDDLALLTTPLEGLADKPARENGYAEGANGTADSSAELANDQVESIVAFASYASSATAEAAEAATEQVLSLLEQLPHWEVELAIGIQATHSHPPSSRLACSLALAALTLSSSVPALRIRLLDSLSSTHSALLSSLSSAAPERILSYLLPALEGFSRAFTSSSVAFTSSDSAPSLPSAEKLSSLTRGASAAFLLPWTPDSDEGRAVLSTLELYRSAPSSSSTAVEQAPGIAPVTPLVSALAMNEAYWSALLAPAGAEDKPTRERWAALLRSSASLASAKGDDLPLSAQIAAEGVAERAMEVWEEMVSKVERVEKARQEGGEEEEETEALAGGSVGAQEEIEVEMAGEVLVRTLRLATLTALISRKLPSTVLPTLDSLLHPTSTQIDDTLQLTALESLQLIATSPRLGEKGKEVHQAAGEIVRRFVLSAAMRTSDDPAAAEESKVVEAAVRCYAALISSAPSHSSAGTAAIQTLLNHVAAAERQGYEALPGENDGEGAGYGSAERDKEMGAANAVLVVAGLTREAGEVQLIRITLSTLQHHLLTTPSPLVLSACLAALVSLAPYCPDAHTFRDLLRAVCASSSSSSAGSIGNPADDAEERDDQRYASALTALSRLAEIAARKKEVKEVGEGFLTEVLGLFASKAASLRGEKVSREQRTSTLLALVPVLSTYLRLTSFSPSSRLPSSLSALFRTFWYTCLLSGFLSRPGWGKLSEWQQDALRSVALRSPPLVAGVSGEMVDMMAALEGVLKGGEHVMSVEAIRGDLAAGVPSQASAARSLPPTQAVFLATVLRLESLRAEAGALAPFFTYLGVAGLSNTDNKSAALADTLRSVGDKVLSVYQARLSRQVTAHELDPAAYAQVREVLLFATHSSARVRETALRYLDNLLSSFPSLVCDLGVVTVMLELLTVLRRSCLAEFMDEYTPVYTFTSSRGGFTLTLPDDYPMRNRVLRALHQSVRAWLLAGITRSPLEMQGLLQEYIDVSHDGYKAQMNVFADDEMGKSVALELVKTPPSNGKYAALPAWGNWNADASSSFARSFAAKSFFGGEAQRSGADPRDVLEKLETLSEQIDKHKLPYKLPELRDLFYRGAALLVKAAEPDFDILHHIVVLPIRLFTEASIAVGQEVWTWVADARPELEPRVVAEVLEAWAGAAEKEQGLFARTLDPQNPLNQETQYNPTDKGALTRDYLLANRVFSPMLALLEFLASRFQAFRYRNADLVHASMRFVVRCLEVSEKWSLHPLSRELRFRFLSFGFCILQGTRFESVAEYNFRNKLYDAVLQWFSHTPLWSFGSNRIQLKADLQAIDELLSVIAADVPAFDSIASASDDRASSLPGRISIGSAKEHHRLRQQLVKVLLNDEADRVRLWINPLQDGKRGPLMSGEVPATEELRKLARFAFSHWPKVTIFLPDRFKAPPLAEEVTRVVRADPEAVQDCPDALAYFVGEQLTRETKAKLRHLLFWAPVPVPSALRFLQPKFGNDPILLQYALRVLEHHPVEVTFFYIPQVVQALRTDETGYAEQFIFETSKISQLFCHQIIWNMKANAYRGDDAEEPDPMKPTLDRMVSMIVESLSGDAKEFYQREFSFFDEVTSISGKLKPYIKASKPEKKAKIDEEMEKIKVDPGVYLPSNPDGEVVDLNRKSGRPLQSHAKAPFMATFRVRRTRKKVDTDDLEAQDVLIDVEDAENTQKEEYDTWQAAIFKVGDDCRQDVLALQIIAMSKNVFNSLGLDLLVTPYRVTATGPGMGVIDVVPNATSRDEMGRAKINDLQSFFVMKYGPPDSIEFQRARTNFIQSMAAYSLLCYIVQIKDRHNGNIMIDGRGCITHIDFGFLFDIGPGGVKFEPNSFKLSHEMVVLMGGRESVGFRQFRELTVKAFLAARYYAQAIVDTTHLMLAAEFPSFKGEGTLDRLKGRFRLDLSEKDAAEFMVDIINDACENKRSIVYDEFQRVTNGIPYTR